MTAQAAYLMTQSRRRQSTGQLGFSEESNFLSVISVRLNLLIKIRLTILFAGISK